MNKSLETSYLKELGEWGKSYSYSRALEGEGELKHFHYGDIHGDLSGVVCSGDLPSVVAIGHHIHAFTGDVIFADASEDYDALGKAAVLKIGEDDKVISGLHTHRFTPNQSKLNGTYLTYFTQSKPYKKFIRTIGNGVSVLGISKSNLGGLEVPLPSLPEQQKIAEFFSALDERIELQAKKVSLLKEQKRGYQQRIFSRELAFTDENSNPYPEWTEKKLGEVAKMVSGHSFKESDYVGNGSYRVITNANVQVGRYLDLSSASSVNDLPDKLKPYQLLNKNDILITLDGNVGRASMVPEGNFVLAQRVGLLLVDSGVNSLFLYDAISHPNFKYEMESKMQGGGLKHIYARDVEGYVISLPSLPEQQKIADFFSALDENISLHERRLELLKEQKKGYLQGIFG